MFKFELFRGKTEQTKSVIPVEKANTPEISGMEFKNRVNLLEQGITEMAAKYEQLRKLPVGDEMQRREAEHLRALKIEELKNGIISALGEERTLQKFAEGRQTMSYFRDIVIKFETDKLRLEKLLQDTNNIIIDKGYTREAA